MFHFYHSNSRELCGSEVASKYTRVQLEEKEIMGLLAAKSRKDVQCHLQDRRVSGGKSSPLFFFLENKSSSSEEVFHFQFKVEKYHGMYLFIYNQYNQYLFKMRTLTVKKKIIIINTIQNDGKCVLFCFCESLIFKIFNLKHCILYCAGKA